MRPWRASLRDASVELLEFAASQTAALSGDQRENSPRSVEDSECLAGRAGGEEIIDQTRMSFTSSSTLIRPLNSLICGKTASEIDVPGCNLFSSAAALKAMAFMNRSPCRT